MAHFLFFKFKKLSNGILSSSPISNVLTPHLIIHHTNLLVNLVISLKLSAPIMTIKNLFPVS
ncbi:Uncharacterised protein [Yersinia frederiksenii]|jgi:hypothetical protein|nr:Uncharacterised protein [Yersinia frederiksenii]CNL22936.1 Uncharacterised protein [Yersinia frederiksenii]CQH40170.1 Uncharacterised protein [Yersinia frederiksenii]CQJ02201.1 Uncharacterised protein [Yersinia frederiksenii]